MNAAGLRSAALVLPLVLFLGVFFFWPLATMLATAVSDDAVGKAFPTTAAALSSWDGAVPPDAAIQTAVATDLRVIEDRSVLGDAVRRLNSAVPGFRSLITKTYRTVRQNADAPLDLTAIDAQWGDPAVWRGFARAVPPYTDRNLLAAVDLQRGPDGDIRQVGEAASANRVIMVRTFVIAASVTALCAAIGLPYAMLIAGAGGWVRTLLLLAVLLPLWTSLLVRTAAWVVLLQNNGLVNGFLQTFGLIDHPLPLIFNRAGVVIAMTHVLLPFMVLPIYSVLLTIPSNLMPAAATLGANPLRAFRHVLFPLVLPGLMSGSLLVFMVALGYYITPALVGGAEDQMISSVIAFYATGTANWGMAAALGIILLAATLVLYAVYGRFSRTPPGFGV
ncbi:ABC transporter permease [Aurantimonas sp. C2-6-R+9]|uniref:ABC transporter permease n=1 Tax=unclassified Aurantimonas TaxID=2638230 RepID=UPI002E17BA38|nr:MULTISPECIES: ABC transporter permease [unclassified Aurantimonas]MEC5291533.1 ABC transporter permease [Aurantimonas sp. C2-3-R2]MEC5381681.1 ABC transporter permease [Aurantimonas sp. C2-6-R+9]MEC5412619.1 ABC transporter permease [Aurantimonas sp. C2-4-R8]